MGKRYEPYNESEVREVINSSENWSEALIKLGRSPRGGTDKALKRFVKEQGIDASHFTGRPKPVARRLSDEEYFVKGEYRTTSSLKGRVIKTGKIPYECAICKSEPEWKGAGLVLWLDHIDGDPLNNQLDNFQFACPNCASQLQTHGAKNNISSSTEDGKEQKEPLRATAYSLPPEGSGSRISKRDYVRFGNRRVDREEFATAVADSLTLSEVARKCGGDSTPANVRKARRYIEAWGLSLSHFEVHSNKKIVNRKTKEEVESECLKKGARVKSNDLKRWLWGFGMLDRQCALCELEEEWEGSHLTLQLDHINGEHTDNRLENLRVLCPNCHSQTETFSGGHRRKKAKENAARKCQHCDKDFISFSRVYCSDECRTAGFCENISKAHLGKAQLHSRKVPRPPLAEVQAYVDGHGYLAAGRKWGVSDNAIRKWLRNGIQ